MGLLVREADAADRVRPISRGDDRVSAAEVAVRKTRPFPPSPAPHALPWHDFVNPSSLPSLEIGPGTTPNHETSERTGRPAATRRNKDQ